MDFGQTFRVNALLVVSKHLGHFRQANRWSQLSPSGTAPAARRSHTSVWSDVADGMYVFGGYDGKLFGNSLNDFHFYDRQAQGGWNLAKLEVSLEEFLGYCLVGLMRSDDLT